MKITRTRSYGLRLKTILLSASLLSFSLSALGSESKEFHFTFEPRLEGKVTVRAPKSLPKYQYSTQADSWDDAFREAAKACYRHYKDGRKLTESEGLDIIDTCANPRS